MATRTVDQSRPFLQSFGTCLNFPGSSGSISLGTANPFTASFYFATWIKWAGLNGSFQTVVAKRDAYGATSLVFSMALDQTTGLLNVDTVSSFIPFEYPLPVNRWQHMMWVHDTVGSHELLYINGELNNTQSIGILGTGTNALITIGADQNPSQEWLNGRMDEVVIGTGVPTAAQAYALYIKRANPGTVWTYLKLDEGSGTTANDASGNGNNGIISGATYVTDVPRLTRSVAGARTLVSGTRPSAG